MSLLEKFFPQIREVLRVTCELLGLKCVIPEAYPEEWDAEFQDGKITFQLGDRDFLRFSRYFVDERLLQLEMITENWQAKSEWRRRMMSFRDSFHTSTAGFVASDDHIVDLRVADFLNPFAAIAASPVMIELLTNPAMRESPLFQATADASPQNLTRKCPHCNRVLTVESLEDMECAECGETFWKCERCEVLLAEDPEDLTDCPKCERTFAKVDCPECSETIYADTTKCNECGAELKLDVCPHCEKPLVFSKELGECPYSGCSETIHICPRCDVYIPTDPDDLDETPECPKCHQTMLEIECPECGKDIYADANRCKKCGAEFEFETCPNLECGKQVILHNDVESCPYCEEVVLLVNCRHCSKKSYALDTRH